MSLTITVGTLLNLLLTEEPPPYTLGSEPTTRRLPRSYPGRARRVDRRRLTPYFEACCQGVPDADIARVAGLSVSQVRRWRLALGIHRKRGTTLPARIQGALLGIAGPTEAPTQGAATAEQLREMNSVLGAAGITTPAVRFDVSSQDVVLVTRLGHALGGHRS